MPVAPAAGAKTEALTGTIHELIVADHVANMTVRHVSIVSADGTATALRGDAAATATKGAEVTATGRRNGDALFVESIVTRKLSAAAKVGTEDRVAGRLAFIHADDFETGKTSYQYEVHGDDGRVTGLKLHIQPETLQAGMKIAATGNRLADSGDLEASLIDIEALPEATTDTTASTSPTALAVMEKATTTHSVLVTLLKFSDTPTDPMPVSTAQDVMSNNPDAVAKYFKEASYGQHVLNVTVTPWVRSSTLATPTSCGSTQWAQIQQAADAAAKAAGYTATYEYHVYVFPRVSACGWSGLAYIGNPKWAYINGAGAVATKVIAHEMGHNFGLMHAASVDCGSAVIGGTCTVSEYGDSFNTMGMGNSMHYGAAQKAYLGWIASGAVKVHSSGTATYTINPLELAGGTTYAVKIPVATKRTYWVEYRQPLGFDAPLSAYPTNGVQIRVALPFETTCSGCNDDTQFLDLTPATSSKYDGALVVGQTFRDPTYGTTIKVNSASSTGVSVTVSSTGSTSTLTSTTTTLASSANPVTAGTTVTFTSTVTGSSPTGTVSFKNGGTALSGCSAVALVGTGNVRTATCSTSSLAAGTYSIVGTYGGDGANSGSSSGTVSQSVSTLPTSATNVALSTVGAIASASTTASNSYLAKNVINGDRKGANWGNGSSGWQDATASAYPDWVQINFNGSKTITKVVVFSRQDSSTPVEPTDTMTFTLYGLKDFTVQGWNGSSWVTLGTVTGNSLVKKTVSFSAFKTDRIRVNVTRALTMWTRIVEIEAWGN